MAVGGRGRGGGADRGGGRGCQGGCGVNGTRRDWERVGQGEGRGGKCYTKICFRNHAALHTDWGFCWTGLGFILSRYMHRYSIDNFFFLSKTHLLRLPLILAPYPGISSSTAASFLTWNGPGPYYYPLTNK